MGSVYSREILGCHKPRVGLLCNGTEDNKGTELTQEAFKRCRHVDIDFIGNVEGHDLFHNRVDVVVCDGFVGNIVLKTLESFAKGLFAWLKSEMTKNPKRMLGALLARNALPVSCRPASVKASTRGSAKVLENQVAEDPMLIVGVAGAPG